MGGTTNVFIIYTREESAILLQLLREFDPLKKDFKISFWYDDPVDQKKHWSPQITSRFEDADVYLLLVNNALMHSKFIEQVEFKMIIDKYKSHESKVIPLILEKCPWDVNFEAEDYNFSLKELRVLPKAGRPIKSLKSTDTALHEIAVGVKDIMTYGDKNYLKAKPVMAKVNVLETDRIKNQIEVPSSEDTKAKEKLVEEKKRPRTEVKEKRNSDQKRRQEVRRHEEHRTTVAEPTEHIKEKRVIQQGKNKVRRKGWLVGASIAALLIFGILFFPQDKKMAKQDLSSQTAKEIVAVKEVRKNIEPSTINKPEITSLNAGASISKLDIGDKFQDGIVFKIDGNDKTGMISSMKDIGPMIWSDATKIDEQLGEGWRLPTLDELKLMYKTIGQGANNSGQFVDEFYWSATPFDDNQARVIRFRDGNTSYHYNSRGTHREFLVRAVRDFE